MEQKTHVGLVLAVALALAAGCRGGGPKAEAPSEGTVVRQDMTSEERIRRIQDDPNIPPEYKQTYINSVLAESQSKGGEAK